MRRLALLSGLIGGLLIVAGFAIVLPTTAQTTDPSPLHPAFPLLDADGNNVLDANTPYSPMQTCGTCHDTAFISEHSAHADLGFSSVGSVTGALPWVDGIGWFGGWNAITYPDVDMSIEDWAATYGWRHVGGGPTAQLGAEMDCFLCHMASPNNDARIKALQERQFAWAATATLDGSGIVGLCKENLFPEPQPCSNDLTQTDNTADTYLTYNADAFDAEGNLRRAYISIDAPADANCAACHGVVDANTVDALMFDPTNITQWHTLTTGQVFSPDRVSGSGLNLADKFETTRTWDIHAERVVACTDCHYSLNNPIFYEAPDATRPDHLAFDPRRMDYDDFLLRPLHQFANGGADYVGQFPVFERASRDCVACHDADATHEWLEYRDRHLDVLACQTCHIPEMQVSALEAVDWTVLTADGGPSMTFRGLDTSVNPAYITGYTPLLLPDRDDKLAPHNVVSAWYWVAGEPAAPVSQADLQAAYFEGDTYAPAIITALDSNGDAMLDAAELRLDTDARIDLIAGRLVDLGLDNPRIMAHSDAYALNHNVTHGQWATRDCATCHTEDSRLSTAFTLANFTPGNVQPTLINTALTGSLITGNDGVLRYQPDDNGLYVLGRDSVALVDWLGALIFIGALLVVTAHAGLRYVAARRYPTPSEPALEEIYMYSIYERQWHWLQSVVIFGLLFTGLVIHKPDLFGMFSFRGVVLVHNALALLLIINAALAAFYHLASGEIQQFLPKPRGFFGQMFAQARYYAYGIFRNEPHPFEKTPQRKLNPIQQLTYFGLLNVLLPLQVITGVLIWGAQRFPDVTEAAGGLPFLGPTHTLVSWLMATFIVVHVYMTTTGHTPFANIRAMIFGWDEVETHNPSPSTGD